jgi:16S rRNA (guanine(966)-N(2))-methyltransferase RsmD
MSKRDLFIRIEAGEYKGQKIKLPSLGTTRSTKSILKNSFFNSIQLEISGAIFVELFGGSGSIGLEALSRGAKRAYFIEKDTNAYEILSQNAKSISPDKTELIYGDTFVEFPKLLHRLNQRAIFYIDPPFDIREGMEDIYKKSIDLISTIPKTSSSLIAIEHISKLKLPKVLGEHTLVKSKKFGKSSISIYR